METTLLINLESIAKQLKLPPHSVRPTAELLEEGNTVPFITRYRKDQTGGLDEQQIRAIEKEITRARMLMERKEAILKSIASRDQLTPGLAEQIHGARSLRLLEDIYLPYKPKKQTLAALARSRGLEPLATAILAGAPETEDLQQRAAELVDADRGLPDVGAVLEGLQHLVAEHFGNHPKLRSHLRRHMWRHCKLTSKKIEEPQDAGEASEGDQARERASSLAGPPVDRETTTAVDSRPEATATALPSVEVLPPSPIADAPVSTTDEATTGDAKTGDAKTGDAKTGDAKTGDAKTGDAKTGEAKTGEAKTGEAKTDPPSPPDVGAEEPPVAEQETEPESANGETVAEPAGPPVAVSTEPLVSEAPPAEAAASKDIASRKKETISRRDQRRETRRRRRERLVQAFKDYFDFSDPIGRVPHHRILAINRGERTKVLRVKLECPDLDKFQAEVEQNFVAADHMHADFLRRCIQDAVTRLLVPSLEREVRRELNDKAEEHAVSVFARNLRKLLLQPPLRQRRVVAIDPGFRSGCKLISLDEFGNVLGHTFIHLVGKEPQKQNGRASLVKFVQQYQATVIAIGNGTACRETEELVADVLMHELKDQDVAYLIVNEAGASVYSTSELGREELPNDDPTVRSAVSIGRRSLDPLSELVKIDPASIGVGLYQHDVKAKHLRESLDAVVESCVNYVGVDVNSASPSLLRYVSGLNTLTARRIFEHRQQHGPFRNREQLKEVSGIGESTYVQAAGFLKIADGENPLDGTWIHPESYAIADRVLEAIGFGVIDLRPSRGITDDVPEEAVRNTSEGCSDTSAEASGTGAPAAVEPARVVQVSLPEEADSSAPAESSETDATAVAASPSPSTQAHGATAVSSPPAELSTDPTPQPSVDRAAAKGNGASVPTTTSTVIAAHAGAEACPKPASAHAARMQELAEKLAGVDVDQLAPDLGVGKLMLQDMLAALARPGRDPREDLPPPIFRRGVLKLENLKPGMELSGTVLNVVDFGAFVDIGLVDSGLVHVSRLADRFISDPHDVVSVGDILRVWVVEVDQKRRRVSLTAIEPGTERPKPEKRKPKSGRSGAPPSKKGHSAKFKRPPQRGKGTKTHVSKPKSKPKPVVPITKEMEEGKEPMRTFGDLKQLFEKRKQGEGE